LSRPRRTSSTPPGSRTGTSLPAARIDSLATRSMRHRLLGGWCKMASEIRTGSGPRDHADRNPEVVVLRGKKNGCVPLDQRACWRRITIRQLAPMASHNNPLLRKLQPIEWNEDKEIHCRSLCYHQTIYRLMA
jgi:hypothetical protein